MTDERWRRLGFREDAEAYTSGSQKARVWTEAWVRESLFCPNCGESSLRKHDNNRPVADFFCRTCDEDFELKSQKKTFGRKITDGALRTMNARLAANDNPNLLLLNYDAAAASVTNVICVPKHFFVPDIIEARKPLAATARRAGWQGCNILIGDIPASGKIWIVRDSAPSSRDQVLQAWQSTLFLREISLLARGWLVEVMKCVEQMGRDEFTLADVYAFEGPLSLKYPGNANVRPKIRQQLQVLRDQGFLYFLGGGKYRLGHKH